MQLSIDQKDIDKFLMIGDKVLIKPKNPQSQTKTGLYLPPSVQQGEKIQASPSLLLKIACLCFIIK